MSEVFKVVPANAGAGKTHYIKETLTEWVKDGEVAPERILAVTFTEAGAEELRERIRSTMLKNGMVGAALAVERAYISTIHGLGRRFLTEHAFAAGGSPQPDLLDESSRDLLIRKAIAESEELDVITRDLERFGYRYKLKSAEDQFRDVVLNTIDQLRNLGAAGEEGDIAAHSVALLRATYGDVATDGTPIELRLQRAINAMLEEFPDGIAKLAKSATAQKSFRKDLGNLQNGRNIDALQKDWFLWQGLRNLRQSKKGSATPEGYDELAEKVISAAEGILRHPGPLEDACLHLEYMIKGAQGIIAGYSKLKRSIGVVDFADMIAGAETLLRENAAVLDAILAEVDCVVIDEFQDTNPVQFAFLWRLASKSKRTVLVGDTKQSIMGFQGADVRLTEALMAQHEEAVEQLPFNWRSDPRLVSFVNGFSKGLFGENYNDVAAKRDETGNQFLEVIRAPKGRSSRSGETRPYHNVAIRIAEMIEGGDLVTDRTTGESRAVKPSDIAVLCQSHSQLKNYAEALMDLGVPVQVDRDGWLDSPVVQLASFAFAYAADPEDRYAALGFLTLGAVAMPLQEALEKTKNNELLNHPVLKSLLEITEMNHTHTMSAFVTAVIERSGLAKWILSQPNPRQLRADLLRLESEAQAFCSTQEDMRAAAGFYGNNAKVFLGWLVKRQSERGADRHPKAGGDQAVGVELVTWHGSKGREWPVVVVAQLDKVIKPRVGVLKAEFDNFTDLDNVLASAKLAYFPNLALPEKSKLFADRARPEEEKNARRLLYVALTRARDLLLLEWPDAVVGKSGGKDDRTFIDLFIEDSGIELDDGCVIVGDQKYPATITSGIEVIPEIFGEATKVKWPDYTEFGVEGPGAEGQKTPWRAQPSALVSETPDLELSHETIGSGVQELSDFSATDRGTAWHLALRVFLSSPETAGETVQSATGLSDVEVEALRAQASSLKVWLTEGGYTKLHLELPIQRREDSGAEMNAIIDCLAESENGYLIVDHKSGSAPNAEERFAGYWPQLDAYRQLVEEVLPNKPVNGLVINWVSEGRVSIDC